MFDLLKNRFHHMLTSSRRIVNEIRTRTKDAEEKYEIPVAKALENLPLYAQLGDAKGLEEEFKNFVDRVHAYHEDIVIGIEEDANIVIFRNEETIIEFSKQIQDIINEYSKSSTPDKTTITLLTEIKKEIDDLLQSLKDSLATATKQARDQYRDKEHFRDKIISARKDFLERHAAKDEKTNLTAGRNLTKVVIEDIKKTHALLKSIHDDEKKNKNKSADEKELESVCEKLESDMKANKKALQALFMDLFTIMRFAIYHYFEFEENIVKAETFIEHLEDDAPLELIKKLSDMLEKEKAYIKRESRAVRKETKTIQKE